MRSVESQNAARPIQTKCVNFGTRTVAQSLTTFTINYIIIARFQRTVLQLKVGYRRKNLRSHQ